MKKRRRRGHTTWKEKSSSFLIQAFLLVSFLLFISPSVSLFDVNCEKCFVTYNEWTCWSESVKRTCIQDVKRLHILYVLIPSSWCNLLQFVFSCRTILAPSLHLIFPFFILSLSLEYFPPSHDTWISKIEVKAAAVSVSGLGRFSLFDSLFRDRHSNHGVGNEDERGGWVGEMERRWGRGMTRLVISCHHPSSIFGSFTFCFIFEGIRITTRKSFLILCFLLESSTFPSSLSLFHSHLHPLILSPFPSSNLIQSVFSHEDDPFLSFLSQILLSISSLPSIRTVVVFFSFHTLTFLSSITLTFLSCFSSLFLFQVHWAVSFSWNARSRHSVRFKRIFYALLHSLSQQTSSQWK